MIISDGSSDNDSQEEMVVSDCKFSPSQSCSKRLENIELQKSLTSSPFQLLSEISVNENSYAISGDEAPRLYECASGEVTNCENESYSDGEEAIKYDEDSHIYEWRK